MERGDPEAVWGPVDLKDRMVPADLMVVPPVHPVAPGLRVHRDAPGRKDVLDPKDRAGKRAHLVVKDLLVLMDQSVLKAHVVLTDRKVIQVLKEFRVHAAVPAVKRVIPATPVILVTPVYKDVRVFPD